MRWEDEEETTLTVPGWLEGVPELSSLEHGEPMSTPAVDREKRNSGEPLSPLRKTPTLQVGSGASHPPPPGRRGQTSWPTARPPLEILAIAATKGMGLQVGLSLLSRSHM